MYIVKPTMKTFRQLSLAVTPLALAVLLLQPAKNAWASGPGGGASSGGANSAGTTGGVSVGVSSSGGGHGGTATVSSAGHSTSAPAVSGARPNVSFSNSAARPSTGSFVQSAAVRSNAPAFYSQNAVAPANAPRAVSRPTNAWSGNVTRPSNGDNLSAGQHLYPGAYGSNLPTYQNGGNGRNTDRYRFPRRYYYDPHAYGRGYAPFIGYDVGYYGAYPYYADGGNLDVANGIDNGTANVTAQYADQGQDANQQPAPQPQAAPQNQTGNATGAQPTVPNNGPDSLVEAVQQELIRRGYFGGKVDAMYSPETKEALRKFQQDHHLAESGLINEATLHALQLD